MNWVDKMWLEKTPAAWYICDPSDFGVIRYQHTIFSPYRPMKPNVHEYPEHATERELLQYKIAVEQAALDGKPIEISKAHRNQWSEYGVHDVPAFCWGEWHYRVARPKIAEGHNPAGVTEDQIPAGWRLFSLEESKHLKGTSLTSHYIDGTRYRQKDGTWSEVSAWRLYDRDFEASTGTLITQKPAGFYLPKPGIAAGHNPHDLTEDQVGVRDGWRLLAPEEIGEHEKDDQRGEIQTWDGSFKAWMTSNGNHGWFQSTTYRTKAAPGRFLPKPKIAKGYNHNSLTEDQVETSKGWRLLTPEEMNGPKQPGVEIWSLFGERWVSAPSEVHYALAAYRTKAAPGEYLPKPKPVQPSPSVQPTTVLGWLNTLPAGYRERALKNRLASRDEQPAISAAGALNEAFTWAGSPEGGSFWGDVHWALCSYQALPPLPETPKKLVPWSLGNFVWPDCVRRRMAGGKVFGVQLATEDGLYIGVHDSTCIGKDHQPIDWKELAEDFEYSVDNGRTWQPCCRTEDAS